MMKKFRIVILFIIILITALIIAMILNVKNINSNNAVGFFVSPFQKMSNQATNSTISFFDTFTKSKQLYIENNEQKNEITSLRQRVVLLENEKFKLGQQIAVNEIQKSFSDIKGVSAQVISRDPFDRFGDFTVDKGSNQGIVLNQSVICPSGIVGKISCVTPNTSKVNTIMNPLFKLTCMEIKTKETGILQGDISLLEKKLVSLVYLNRDCKIQKEDIIVTSKANSVFPPDILVGKVKTVTPSKQGTTFEATIEPFVDVFKINDVFIVTKF